MCELQESTAAGRFEIATASGVDGDDRYSIRTQRNPQVTRLWADCAEGEKVYSRLCAFKGAI